MQYYPQYIHVPTTAPVQQYFADPYVITNRYDLGGTLAGLLGGKGGGGLFGGLSGKANEITGKLGGVLSGNKLSSGAGGIVSGIGSAVGTGLYKLGTGKFDRGTGAGKAISGIGNAAGDLIGKVNPLLGGVVKIGAGLIGGLTNRISGYHLNDATINAINSDTAAMNNTRVADSSYDSIANQAAAQNWGGSFDINDIGSWGWAAKGKVQKEYDKLRTSAASGQNYMAANYANAANNVSQNTMSNLLINSSAFGGPLNVPFGDNPFSHTGSIAVAYGNEQKNLQNQQQMIQQMQPQTYGLPMQQPQQNAFCLGGGIPFACGGKMYADGGPMNTHGSDFTNGLMYINAGGRHEDNPYQGVPMGYDSQGTPNVVEEDEVIVPAKMLAEGGNIEQASDYVLSNRTMVSPEFAEKYQLPYDTTHAEAADILTEESQENPTDIVAQNTDKAIMRELVQDQEMVKQQMQQQQQMQEQMMQQQVPAEQEMMPQAAPEQLEGDALEELAMQQQEGIPMQQPQMSAFGGPLNVFAVPGYIDRAYDPSMYETTYNKPAGNQLNPKYSYGDVWRALIEPALMDWAKKNITPNQSMASRQAALEQINELQRLYFNADMPEDDLKHMRKSDAIEALQKHAKNMGLNVNINDDAFSTYYTNHTGVPGGDIPDTFVDSKNGLSTKSRHAGMRDMISPAFMQYLRNAGVQSMVGDFGYMDEDNRFTDSGLYGFENSLDWEPETDYAYYTPPTTPAAASTVATDAAPADTGITGDDNDEGDVEVEDDGLYPTWMRNLPLWASGLGVLGDVLGITNNPDYTAGDAYADLANTSNGFMPVSYHPTGEQMIYRPYDPVLQTIMNQSDVAAQRRFIQDNSNGNGAMANAAGVALNRNAMLANGQLGLQGRQYNDQLLNNVLQFNNAVNAQNSQGLLSADAQNAANWARQRNMFASLMGESIAAHQAARDRADAARAMNMSNFVQSAGALGKENWYFNQVKRDPTLFGYHNDKAGDVRRNRPATTTSTTTQTSVATPPIINPYNQNAGKSKYDLGLDLSFLNMNPYFRYPYFRS